LTPCEVAPYFEYAGNCMFSLRFWLENRALLIEISKSYPQEVELQIMFRNLVVFMRSENQSLF